MRVLVATDAWHPQINGVVRTYERLAREAASLGAELQFVTPREFFTLPCPTYPEIRLSLLRARQIGKRVADWSPDCIHIATEGPIGLMTRAYCRKIGMPFTTSYHTRFPEYVSARIGVGRSLCYAYQRWFHNSGNGVMVSTRSMVRDLKSRGFKDIMMWSRGVDTELFRPRDVAPFAGQIPVFLYVGRVAVEKNIEAFLRLDLPGRKVVVGDGPQLVELRSKYPGVHFAGPQSGEALARHYACADVFVFPSRTDTFGLVLLEALASGVPVAAFPVTGPKDVIGDDAVGVLGNDLRKAALRALELDRALCREHALKYSWANCARQFIANVKRAQNGRRSARPIGRTVGQLA